MMVRVQQGAEANCGSGAIGFMLALFVCGISGLALLLLDRPRSTLGLSEAALVSGSAVSLTLACLLCLQHRDKSTKVPD